MSWAHIARKDFEDAVRSLLLWALTGLLVLLVAGLGVIPYLLSDTAVGYDEALAFLFTPIAFLIPIMGLIVGYRSIVGERESGSIRFLLGFPNARRDVMIGKLLGRTGVIAVPTIIGFIVGGAVILVLYEGFAVSEYIGLLLFSLLMGTVYVAIAVGVSASVSTRAKAVAGVAGIFVIFDFAWEFIPMAIYWVLERSLPDFTSVPAWYVFVERLSPSQALSAIAMDLVGFIGGGDIDFTTAGRIEGDIPFYLSDWVAWIIVFAWLLVPIGIGYYRFKNAQIT